MYLTSSLNHSESKAAPKLTYRLVWTIRSGVTANTNVGKNSEYAHSSNPLFLSKLTVIVRKFFIRHETFGFCFFFFGSYFIWE